MSLLPVFAYISENDPTSQQVVDDLKSLGVGIPHQLVVIDIASDEYLYQKFKSSTPVVEIGPYHLTGKITKQDLHVALLAAQSRREQKSDKPEQLSASPEYKSTFTEKYVLKLTKHYMFLFNISLVILIAVSFLPPFLLKAQLKEPARIIYSVYRLFCHELAFRSYFLFGEQIIYPRALAGLQGYKTYEEVSVYSDENENEFNGNGNLGYKVALCQRDLAIYGSILIFGIAFSLKKRRFKPISFWLLILATIPILLDGLSQLPGIMPGEFPAWLPIRESTPVLRTITGAFWGTALAAFVYPHLESNFQKSRALLLRKDKLIKTMNEKS